jgi:flagella basal body P-ring formation protein FlgA
VRRVDRIEFLDAPTEGVISANVFGVTSRQAINQTIKVHFVTRPMIVVPRESLRRGQIITHADLTLVPAPRGIPIESAITNIDDAVDMQVVNVLQKDRPITHSSITRPILIERGDMVEVQVIGGGVTVATGARSLSKGAAGDLIAVETLEPRKKIIARVARSGLVEIFTRPPRVR